jgi:tetratricopeptide (TPR) repeat protein
MAMSHGEPAALFGPERIATSRCLKEVRQVGFQPAVHRTIVIVDVENFGDPARTNAHQLAVREGMYEALRQSFAQAGIGWGSCMAEDRGDGVLVLVPPEVPKSWLVSVVPARLAEVLAAHNAACDGPERFRLRMALHAGEVHRDTHGWAGVSLNRAFRLIDASACRAALRDSSGVLAMIISDWFYDEVVRHHPAAQPARFGQTHVVVKETEMTAWIRVLEAGEALSGERAGLVGPALAAVDEQIQSSLPPYTATFTGRDEEQDRITTAATKAAAFPAGAMAEATRTLPRDIASFTGREREFRQLAALAARAADSGGAVSICAIGGMAGIGKTAFAVHAAHQLTGHFPDGQIFLPLHGHTPGQQPVDPAEALASLLLTAGVAAPHIPPGLDARSRLWRHYLAGKRILLLLDDAAGYEQVRGLLPGTAGTLVMITSRRHMTALEDAHTVSLDTLSPAESAELLIRLAIRSDIRASDAAVNEITHLCGYLPLAIGIVARQLHHHPSWSAAQLASDLGMAQNRLRFMHAGNLSVDAVFDLTYQDLAADQRRMFSHLGLHPGTEIDAYIASALYDTSVDQARRLLEDIYDHHLLTEPAHGRYRFHDLIREHARTHGETFAAGERDTAMNRLLDYYLRTVVAASHHYPRRVPADAPSLAGIPPACSPDLAAREDAVIWMIAERLNLYAAATYAAEHNRPRHTVGIASAMHGFLRTRGHCDQAIALHSIALNAARESANRHAEAGALADLGDAQYRTGAYSMATASFSQALELYCKVNDQLGQAGVFSTLGVIQQATGKFQEAAASHEQSLNIYRKLRHSLGEATALNRQGWLLSARGDKKAAVECQEQALVIYRAADDLLGEANALGSLGDVQLSVGDYAAARVSYSRAQELHQDVGNQTGEASALKSLGNLQLATRDYTAATTSLDRALAMSRDLGDSLGEAWGLAALGTLHYRMADYSAATTSLSRALAINQSLGRPLDQAKVLNSLGDLSLACTTPAQAREHYEQALAIGTTIGSPEEEARALEGIGQCHLKEGRPEEGAAALRRALTIYRQIASPGAERVQKTLAAAP